MQSEDFPPIMLIISIFILPDWLYKKNCAHLLFLVCCWPCIFAMFNFRFHGCPKHVEEFQFCGSVHHTMITENTSLMQQDKYIFHLYVFSTCFGWDITHHQELQNCTHSDMVMVPREVRRDVVEEIKWRLARQYYARVGDVKRVERSLVSLEV